MRRLIDSDYGVAVCPHLSVPKGPYAATLQREYLRLAVGEDQGMRHHTRLVDRHHPHQAPRFNLGRARHHDFSRNDDCRAWLKVEKVGHHMPAAFETRRSCTRHDQGLSKRKRTWN